jgi:hypothetical protein
VSTPRIIASQETTISHWALAEPLACAFDNEN